MSVRTLVVTVSGNREHADPDFLFESRALEVLACCGWHLPVRQCVLAVSAHGLSGNGSLNSTLPVGSSSPILASSGVSFEGAVPIGGLSGYVMIGPSLEGPRPNVFPPDLCTYTPVIPRDCDHQPYTPQQRDHHQLPGMCKCRCQPPSRRNLTLAPLGLSHCRDGQ
jgi:hypothetical protein